MPKAHASNDRKRKQKAAVTKHKPAKRAQKAKRGAKGAKRTGQRPKAQRSEAEPGTGGPAPGPGREDIQPIQDLLKEARSKLRATKGLIESNDYRSALPAIEEVLALLEKAGAGTEDKADALVALSKATFFLGNLDRSEAAASKALELLARSGVGTGLKADAYSFYGQVLYSRGEFDRSRGLLEKALSLYEATRSMQGTATVCKRLGSVHLLQGNYGKAVMYYTKALKMNMELKNAEEIASTKVNIALSNGFQGLYDEAVKDLETFLREGTGQASRRTVATAHLNLGYFKTRLGLLDDAMAHYEDGRRIADSIGFSFLEKSMVAGVAEILILRRQFDAAADLLQRNYKDIMAVKAGEQRGEFMMVRGMLFREKGDLKKAEDDFFVAERFLLGGGYSIFISRNYIEWAIARKKAGDERGARELFAKARAVYIAKKLPAMEKRLDVQMRELGLG